MSQDKLALIRQSLAAAESSIKTAKQLLSELESGGLRTRAADLPGIVGIFDGVNMVSEKGETFPIPVNYASKSMLVTGDTLKLVEEEGEKKFKQIEHVKRHKTTGILHRKDGKYKVITPEGSYNVLSASVEHFKGEVGDEVTLQLPAGNLTAAWGAIETIAKKGEKSVEEEEPAKIVVKPLHKPEIRPMTRPAAPVRTSPAIPPKTRPQPPQVKPKVQSPAPKALPPKPNPAPAPRPAPRLEPKTEKVVVKKITPAPAPVLPPPGSDDELR